uniref:AAA family ATPase n=1 Tax=Edaphobacter aggregans TaxID=570835 RepID=UPI0012F78C7F
MRLVKVRVEDFRSIEDSGEFSLHPVTCLVGKNESGKTAILKALQKLKPDDPAKESFSASRDYPRRKWRPDTPIPKDPPAIKTMQVRRKTLKPAYWFWISVRPHRDVMRAVP